MLLALAGFALRVSVVAPRRAAAARALEGIGLIEATVEKLRAGTLMLPGSGTPTPDAPITGPLVTGPAAAALTELQADLVGPMRRSPGELVLAEALAPTHLLLGADADARKAWESLLAQGDEAAQSQARHGLGVVALRAGLRAEAPQDRAFAFDHALWHFDAVPEGAPERAAADFNRVVCLVELGRYDQAREEILGVQADDLIAAAVLGTHLARREPVFEPPKRPPPR